MAGPLLLVDAPYLLYRAFFGLPDSIKGPDGRPVNALLGSTNTILAVAEEQKARAVVACFGPDAAAYRVELYSGYHAHRPPMPRDLAHQWGLAPRLYAALGWSVQDHDSLEADDLLGSLAQVEEATGGKALLFTGDRDMFQCASEAVTVLFPRGGKDGPEEIGPDEVRERYGIEPEQVPDFIALRGDPSDGLPGAKGIGAKTARDLLRTHGTLEGVIAAAHRPGTMTARMAGALTADPATLGSFRDIATLRGVELERPPDSPLHAAAASRAAADRGMKRLAERLSKLPS